MGVSRFRARIRVPLPQVWEFVIKPEHLHVWGPATRPVTGFDRPLQEGDRVTFSRRDFFRSYSQKLLVEKVVPYHSLHFRNLSPGAARITLSVEEARDRESTWIEEASLLFFGQWPIPAVA
jgi:uncharacterized protein YndB with AHSA1/START domain